MSDEYGILRSWWNARDEENFKALGDKVADQHSKFEALPATFAVKPTAKLYLEPDGRVRIW